jgi:PTS system mannitol-specific IIA component
MAPSRSELTALLPDSSIDLAASATDRIDAVRQVGALLVGSDRVNEAYIDEMLDRERAVSTYVGAGVAIPHGTLSGKKDVLVEGLAFLRLDSPVDWNGEQVHVVIGIAAHGRRYITILSQLATQLLEQDRALALRTATTGDQVRTLLGS